MPSRRPSVGAKINNISRAAPSLQRNAAHLLILSISNSSPPPVSVDLARRRPSGRHIEKSSDFFFFLNIDKIPRPCRCQRNSVITFSLSARCALGKSFFTGGGHGSKSSSDLEIFLPFQMVRERPKLELFSAEHGALTRRTFTRRRRKN